MTFIWRASYLLTYADLLQRAGRQDQAAPVIDEADRISEETGEASYVGVALRIRGAILESRGEHGEAMGLLERSIAWSRANGTRTLEMRAAKEMLLTARGDDEISRAGEALRTVLATFPLDLSVADLNEARAVLDDRG